MWHMTRGVETRDGVEKGKKCVPSERHQRGDRRSMRVPLPPWPLARTPVSASGSGFVCSTLGSCFSPVKPPCHSLEMRNIYEPRGGGKPRMHFPSVRVATCHTPREAWKKVSLTGNVRLGEDEDATLIILRQIMDYLGHLKGGLFFILSYS